MTLPLIPKREGAHLRRALIHFDEDLIEVLLDVDSLDAEGHRVREALDAVLSSQRIHLVRYSDSGPPPGVIWHQEGSDSAPVDWLHVEASTVDPAVARPQSTHLVRTSPGGRGVRTAFLYAHPAEWDAATWDGDALVVRERLAARVAETVDAAVFITDKATVMSADGIGWMGRTLCATPARAVSLLSTLLRISNEFYALPHIKIDRRTFLRQALVDLLPAYGSWAACCSRDDLTGAGRISYYARGFEWRAMQALLARDQLAYARSHSTVDVMSEIDACDRVVISLLACFDASAHVVNEVCKTSLKGQQVKWQDRRFLTALEIPAPQLAGLFKGESSAAAVLTIVKTLRNSIHGGGFDITRQRLDRAAPEQHLSIPRSDVAALAGSAPWGGGL